MVRCFKQVAECEDEEVIGNESMCPYQQIQESGRSSNHVKDNSAKSHFPECDYSPKNINFHLYPHQL